MEYKIAFITATRDELKSFSEILGQHFYMAARPDPKKPLTISVHGTWKTGKILIAETVAEEVTGSPYKTPTSFWSSNNEEQYEIQIRDIACSARNQKYRTNRQRRLIQEFLNMRHKLGVLFIHNALFVTSNLADIDIKLGTLNTPNTLVGYKEDGSAIMHPIRWSNLKKHGLCKAYTKAVNDNGIDWVRFVEVTYKNTDVLSDEYLDNLKTWDQNIDGKSPPPWLLKNSV